LSVNGAPGSNVTVSQNGSDATLDLSGLQTTQSQAKAAAISGIQNLTDNSQLTQTVTNLSQTSNNNSTAITNIQNLNDNSLLTQTVNNHTTQISGIQNMTDNSLLTQTVNGHTTQINTLNTQVANNTTQINKNATDISDLQHQVDRNYQTKLGADFALRLIDTKYWSLQAYDIYQLDMDQGHDVVGDGHNFMFGTRVVFKLGKSYEEERLDAQKKDLDALRAEVYQLTHVHAPVK